MARFNERGLQWTDIIGRFEARPYSHHLKNAQGLIGRLEDEGKYLCDEDPDKLVKWQQSCAELWTSLNNLTPRGTVQDLPTAMREFIHAFEHATGRISQIMYGFVGDEGNDQRSLFVTDLLHWLYRSSTYALVSAWIGDKQESRSLTTVVNLVTGEVMEQGTRNEMQVPRKYRKATKRL